MLRLDQGEVHAGSRSQPLLQLARDWLTVSVVRDRCSFRQTEYPIAHLDVVWERND